MKKLAPFFAGLLLCLSTSVFAEAHLDQAMEHTTAAVAEGQAGKSSSLVTHAGFPLKPGHLTISKGYELHDSCSFEQAEVRPFVRVSRKTNPGVRFQTSALRPLCHLHV